MIDTNSDLLALCQSLEKSPALALDTEFIRVRTFFPKPGLIQIADQSQVYLVDPLGIDEWAPFKQLLVNPDVVKVLHACDEDIELFYHLMGVFPVNVFDTQVAAACCGMDFSMGYQRLVKSVLDLDLPKTHSRSDWMQRPLSSEQLKYAADDVDHLLEIHAFLKAKIDDSGLQNIVAGEYQQVVDNLQDMEFGNAINRLKMAWKLNGYQLARVRALAIWRERSMRAKDLPRNRIASNDALMQLAKHGNWSKSQLFDIEGLPEQTARSCGDDLIALLSVEYPQEERLSRPVKADRVMNLIKSTLVDYAQRLGIAEQLLMKKPYTEAMYWAVKSKSSLPGRVSGWRRGVYLEVLDAVVAEL
ncbi:Ribonuclease D [BD1-7 clade bacterium]|uniref:Ribonuclease D n=1 Tax=BD1-7 clade bacterium TaxID=2029982 RepID=A0A5S9NRZ8_9GAMM|nr:Ribonuclease D [BD1-7 clade bacterium]CAA0093289.1 Ribonuclease D [BD1-7 clade bacterium]